jgi:hypothetical protein
MKQVSNRLIRALILASMVFCLGSGKGPEIPLPEHPRPDFNRDTWINLNGQWDFALDPEEKGELDAWYNDPAAFDRRITVPFSWASPMSGVAEKDVHIGWYRRDVAIPNDNSWKDKRIFLVIGACDFATEVWLNGIFIGKHQGGYTPFEFDLSVSMDKSGNNNLVIRVEDKSIGGRQLGKQEWGYGDLKGIWQTVYLEGRTADHILQAHFSPDIDNNKVSVDLQLSGIAKDDLDFAVSFKDGSVETVRHTIEDGHDGISFDIGIPSPRLWNLDDPYLYEVDLVLGKGDKEYDRIHTYFGMRKISTGKLPDSDIVYVTLNDKPVYLRMALDQSYHPDGYCTFPSDEFMKEEILRAKDIGLNGLRVHVKTEVPRKLYWADKLGVLIQADIPNNLRARNDPREGIPDKEGKRNWEHTAWQQIARDYNHPSIFSWVLFNESWGLLSFPSQDSKGDSAYLPETQDWVKAQYYLAKTKDPTRLVEDNSAVLQDHVITDLNSWHQYSPSMMWAPYLDHVEENTFPGSEWNYIGGNKQSDVPMLNSECGAVWGYQASSGDIDLSYDYHIMIDEFRRRPKIAGFMFTEFHDVFDEWNGYYRYDRSRKEFGLDELCPGMTISDFHADMYLIPGELRGEKNGDMAVPSKNTWMVVEPGSDFSMPLVASFMTDEFPSQMTVKTLVHGWNNMGEHKEYSKGQFTIEPQAYKAFGLPSINLTAPEEECLVVLCTYLLDDQAKAVHHNFVPFMVLGEGSKIKGLRDKKTEIIRLAPDEYSKSEWSVKQKSVMGGKKVWGTGTGFFEYSFPWPENIKLDKVAEVEFLGELSARTIQGKDTMEIDLDAGIYIRTGPGDSPNSYLMTDEKKHPSKVTISLNDIDGQVVTLEDDPADHRGLLSWWSQERSGTLTWYPQTWKRADLGGWRLEEAGSYGYLVKMKFSSDAIAKAADEGVLRVRMAVSESSAKSGGLAVYGEKFGRYPLDQTLIIHLK